MTQCHVSKNQLTARRSRDCRRILISYDTAGNPFNQIVAFKIQKSMLRNYYVIKCFLFELFLYPYILLHRTSYFYILNCPAIDLYISYHLNDQSAYVFNGSQSEIELESVPLKVNILL